MSHLNRRVFLSAAAAGTVLSPTIASATLEAVSTDPIFAVIEAHRSASDTADKYYRENGRLDDILPEELRRTHLRDLADPVVETDAPEWIQNERALRTAAEAEEDAALALASTIPTTAAGVSAVLAYCSKWVDKGSLFPDFLDDDGHKREFEFFLMINCAATLAKLGA